jgi:hypothetical protein
MEQRTVHRTNKRQLRPALAWPTNFIRAYRIIIRQKRQRNGEKKEEKEDILYTDLFSTLLALIILSAK